MDVWHGKGIKNIDFQEKGRFTIGLQVKHVKGNTFCSQSRSQPHSPGWARVPLSSFIPQILIIFSFFLKLYLFCSSLFTLRVGELAHPGRPWLRHCLFSVPEECYPRFCNFFSAYHFQFENACVFGFSLTITFEGALLLLLKNKHTNKEMQPGLTFGLFSLIFMLQDHAFIMRLRYDEIYTVLIWNIFQKCTFFETAHHANLKNVSGWHMFQNATQHTQTK